MLNSDSLPLSFLRFSNVSSANLEKFFFFSFSAEPRVLVRSLKMFLDFGERREHVGCSRGKRRCAIRDTAAGLRELLGKVMGHVERRKERGNRRD